MSGNENGKRGPANRLSRFSLGSLLILVTAGAIWMAVISNRAHRLREVRDALLSSGADLGYDYEYDGLSRVVDARPPVPRWIRDWIGEEYFVDIVNVSFQSVENATSADLEPIRDLKSVRRIDIDYTSIDDISAIAGQTGLQWLDLEESGVDSGDLVHLESLNSLSRLILTRNAISDEGLEVVADMSELVDLRLNETQVTDESLVHFQNLKKLRELDLEQTNVTADGVRWLQAKIPGCEINWDGAQ
ncbi:MAG: hypothetical protein AAF456_12640 [Planctomycetota bacterium]